ncbi:OmpH family outer membrane protein [Aquimarina sp. 2201CG5-10]|uniref:OmpH family outer membrane protein n=1 Tax=Aquimarina callyspongiae TaxID=3098150 RepID=UPI002AB57A35|nr:OmpH family outer membrane protein [Aquimarina sp. 2201CG5-10]MDY8137304.1 OmpH family outer membrane protein [Aquimarina sp. 2201CG5-10]
MKHIIFLIILYGFGSQVFSQENLGYISYDQIVNSIPQYSNKGKSIESLKTKYNDSVRRMIKGYESTVSCATNVDFTDKEIKKKENELILLEKRIEALKTNYLEEVNKEKQRINIYLKNKIWFRLKNYCTKNNIKSIVYKQDILYCPTCVDYTSDFIKYLKE